MRPLPIVHEDVTGRDDVPEPAYLEVVAGFEELGYRSVARVVGRPREGYDAFIAEYAEEHHASLRAGMPRPDVLLLSPDALVLVQVAWFFDFPAVVASTRMADGTLVETHRRWDAVPPWQRRGERIRRRASVDGEMRRAETRGRAVHVVDGDDPSAFEAAHRAHVASTGGTPVPAPSTPGEVVAELEHRFARSLAVSERFVLVYKLASRLLVVLVGLAMLAVAVTQPWPLVVVGLVLLGLLTPLLLPRLWWWLSYARWWRPSYRAAR